MIPCSFTSLSSCTYLSVPDLRRGEFIDSYWGVAFDEVHGLREHAPIGRLVLCCSPVDGLFMVDPFNNHDRSAFHRGDE